MSNAALESFIESAPPGELNNVAAALKTIVGDDGVVEGLEPAFKKYNEEQLSTVKLPGGSKEVLVSQYNELPDGRYFDVESQSSFEFDHVKQKASGVQSYVHESEHRDLVKSLLKSFSTHAEEHYPSSSYGVYPTSTSEIAILLAGNKYSPSNFWNGRWRSTYLYSPSSNSITGQLSVDVHYYEDGNVRLLASKPVSINVSGGGNAAEIVRKLAAEEKKYQEDLNRAFGLLSENAFKALRRQLPVTRQKIEWEKISGYRLGHDIGGGARR